MFLGLLLTVSVALAQDSVEKEIEPTVIYKNITSIDFEGVEVEGELVKPQGALLMERQRAAFNPLIRLRSDFNHEMSMSVSQIK